MGGHEGMMQQNNYGGSNGSVASMPVGNYQQRLNQQQQQLPQNAGNKQEELLRQLFPSWF